MQIESHNSQPYASLWWDNYEKMDYVMFWLYFADCSVAFSMLNIILKLRMYFIIVARIAQVVWPVWIALDG